MTSATTSPEAASGDERTQTISLWCGVIAAVVALIPVLVALQRTGWHASILVRMEAGDPIAPYATAGDPDFKFVGGEGHYDGVYFYAIARDPLARGEASTLIDLAAYRYGHAGYGWVGWALSLGRPRAVPVALLAAGVTSLAVAAIAFSRLSAALGWTPWGGLAVSLNPGLVYSLTALTSETLGAALLALSLLLWVRRRYGWAALSLAALCLVKEPFVLVPAGIGLWECGRWLRARDTAATLRRLALLAAGPLVFACWYVYVRVQFGEWSFQATEGFFSVPPLGWLEAMRVATDKAFGDEFQVGSAAVPLLAVAGAALVAGIVRALRFRSPVDVVFVLLALLALSLRPLGVEMPKDMMREVSVPAMLLPLVLAGRVRTTRS
jgi:hypothetical protein